MTHSFLTTFNPDWAQDRVLVLLLMCLTLFNPSNHDAVIDAPAVAIAYSTYKTMLLL